MDLVIFKMVGIVTDISKINYLEAHKLFVSNASVVMHDGSCWRSQV